MPRKSKKSTVMYDELIHRVRDKSNKFTLEEARVAIESTLGVIADIMLEGGVMQYKGFGKLGSVYKEGHKGRNPQNGDPYDVPGRMVPFFEASRLLRDEVAGT